MVHKIRSQSMNSIDAFCCLQGSANPHAALEMTNLGGSGSPIFERFHAIVGLCRLHSISFELRFDENSNYYVQMMAFCWAIDFANHAPE